MRQTSNFATQTGTHLTTFLFLQRFENGVAVPMPAAALMDLLGRHGHAGQGRGDPEFTFAPDTVAACCTVIGSSSGGIACIGFERPRYDDALRRLVWQCMECFGCSIFDDALETVATPPDAADALPARLAAACRAGVRAIATAQQLWPQGWGQAALADGLADGLAEAPPGLPYTNPNRNGADVQIVDEADAASKEVTIRLAIRPEACNPGTLRVLRNLELRLDAAVGANPGYRATFRYAYQESSQAVTESVRLGEYAHPASLAFARDASDGFVPDTALGTSAAVEAAKLRRHVQSRHHLVLDGGADSIALLAGLLDKLHGFYRQEAMWQAPGQDLTSAVAASWSIRAGCYLGTLIAREPGAQWGYVERGQWRVPALRTRSGRLCFPHQQVFDHIVNAVRDNVAGWYAALAADDTAASAAADFAPAPLPVLVPATVPAWPEDAPMAAAIRQTRAGLTAWRRKAGAADFRVVAAPGPQWMRSDPLGKILRRQRLLLEKGFLVWGALVRADARLFAPGADDLPGTLLYSLDPHFDARPQALCRIATELEMHQGPLAHPELAPIGAWLASEGERAFSLKVPALLTEHPVTVARFMAMRAQLPGAVLAGAWFPLLTHPTTQATLILPRQFWPPQLAAQWKAGGLSD